VNICNASRKYEVVLILNIILISICLSFFYNKAIFIIALFALITLTIITFAKVEIAIISALIWPYVQYFLTRDLKLLPDFFTLIDECFLLSIVIYLVWNLLNHKIRVTFTYFDAALISFLLVGLVSAVLNKNPIINTILGLRCYVQYIVLYYAISYLKISDKFCWITINTVLTLVVLQFPFTVYQYFTWTPSSLVNDHADAAVGTFSAGAANILGLLMLVFLFYAIKMKDEFKSPIKYLLLISLCFSMILAHSKLSYILLIIVLIYDYVSNMQKRLHLSKILFSIVGMFVLFKIALLVSNDIANLLSFDSFMILIQNQIEDKEGGGRIVSLLLTFTILYKYAFSSFIGLGPGMYSSYAGISLKSHYLVDILNIDLEHRGTRLDPDIVGVLGEYGYLGFLFFSLMLAILLFRNLNHSNLLKNSFWCKYASWFKLFTIIFFLGAFVNGIWQAQFFAVTYWVVAGIFNKKYLESL